MNDDDYVTTQAQLQTIAIIVMDMDIEGFIERIVRAQTIAPFIDPTLYSKGMAKLRQVEDLARSIQGFQRTARYHKSLHEKENDNPHPLQRMGPQQDTPDRA